MNGVQTRFKCKLDVKRCKRFVFPPSSLLPRSNALKTKAIRYFQTDRTLTRIVSPPLDNNDYSVELFSDDMCMSRMNLYRKLQSITGQKPTEFIRSIRLKKAARLLTDTDLSIVEISEKVGFATPSYFSKCFKEMFGVLPTQYHK